LNSFGFADEDPNIWRGIDREAVPGGPGMSTIRQRRCSWIVFALICVFLLMRLPSIGVAEDISALSDTIHETSVSAVVLPPSGMRILARAFLSVSPSSVDAGCAALPAHPINISVLRI